jgi:thiol-disulfide isomerase/thioredoxin
VVEIVAELAGAVILAQVLINFLITHRHFKSLWVHSIFMKDIMTLILRVLFILCIASIGYAQNKFEVVKQKIKTITVVNQALKSNQTFNYIDYLGNSVQLPFKSDTLSIETYQPITSYFYTSSSNIKYFFIEPLDTVYIKIVGNGRVLYAKNPHKNNLFTLLNQLEFNVGSINFSYKEKYAVALKQIEENYEVKNKIIAAYDINVDGTSRVKRFVDYDKYTSLISLSLKHKNSGEVFYKLLKAAKIEDTSLLTFRLFVNKYNEYQASKYGFHIIDYFNKVNNNYPKTVKNFLLFDLIKAYQPTTKKKLDTLKVLVNLFSKSASNKDQVDFLKTCLKKILLDRTANQEKKIKLLGASTNQTVSFDEILQKYKGKIVYVDIWASWCIPCINEMSFSKSLYDQLKKNALPIEFIYISQDESLSLWMDKLKQLKLPKERNFLFLKNNELRFFFEKHRINTIPRYFIINKNGKIVDADAPRPSDNNLRYLLTNLSKQ